MNIQYCSDLHLEFPDNKEYILDNPIEPIADIAKTQNGYFQTVIVTTP